jgi:putative oxidoreductase
MCQWLKQTKGGIGFLFLRFALGIMFTFHGAQKLFGAFSEHGIQEFTQGLTNMGIPFPQVSAYLAGGAEFFGGILLILGLLTRLAAVPLLVVMLVAIFKAHWANGFSMQNGGFEYPFVISGGLLLLLIEGAGCCSMDQKCAEKK